MWCGHALNEIDGSANRAEVHEIERKSHAPKRWAHRCNYLLLCHQCHSGPFAAMPHAKQLAVKLVRDPNHFELVTWLRLRDPELRAPERVTIADVAHWLTLGRNILEMA
jgi:hypothetical protein